jgi:hypothetical protein
LNAGAAAARTAYITNAAPGGPGGVLDAIEMGHGYNAGNFNSIQQTSAGIWIQVVGGADLNDPSVQAYLQWLRNRYRYTDSSGGVDVGWGISHYYYMWSQSKALSFLDDSGIPADAGNLDTSALGLLAPGAAPAFAFREVHRDPTTDPRVPIHGPELGGYYSDPSEPARWYYDGAYALMTQQDASGTFIQPVGFWDPVSSQSYAILYLERSVGGRCNDTDGDGVCDFEDNCPATPMRIKPMLTVMVWVTCVITVQPRPMLIRLMQMVWEMHATIVRTRRTPIRLTPMVMVWVMSVITVRTRPIQIRPTLTVTV